MLEELKEEEIVNKVGGRFKLSTLIQKRMIALNQGARPLVDLRGADKMTIVIQEIMQDKIYLDLTGNLQTSEPTEEDGRRDGRSYPAVRIAAASRRCLGSGAGAESLTLSGPITRGRDRTAGPGRGRGR